MPTRILNLGGKEEATPQQACNEATSSQLVHSKQIGSKAKQYSRDIFVRSDGKICHPMPYACKMQGLTVIQSLLALTP
jgi:hypothetical protein